MSSLADRGGSADVLDGADLSAEGAARWMERREAAAAENAARRERREGCLRDSALVGAGCGAVGGPLAWRVARRFHNIGPMLTTFSGFVGFFMPFMFVSNVLRYRCQSKGIVKPAVPRSLARD